MQMQSSPQSLSDSFGRIHRYLRVSVTERCNLRCIYCMPPEGIPLQPRDNMLRFEEILRLCSLFVRLGVEKIRFTGGEPMVRRGLEGLIANVAQLDGLREIAMTTNGVMLAEKAQLLKELGVTHLNVSLDTLRSERFQRIALRNSFDRVMAGLDAAIDAEFPSLKLNMVVIGGINEDEILDFVELAREQPLQVRFIEYMPFAGNQWQKGKMVPLKDMMQIIKSRYDLQPVLDPDPARVASVYHIPNFLGSIGFIASMTQNFCSGCNRLRLTADGALKTCLFHHPEQSLRDAMRAGATDSELEELIRRNVHKKPKGHQGAAQLASSPGRSMIQIGG